MSYSHFLLYLPLFFSLEKIVKDFHIFSSELLKKNDTTFIREIFEGAMYNIKDTNVKLRKEICQNILFNLLSIEIYDFPSWLVEFMIFLSIIKVKNFLFLAVKKNFLNKK